MQFKTLNATLQQRRFADGKALRLGALLLLFVVGGCAHQPYSVPAVVGNAPTIQAVQKEPATHKQALVRWGGTVVSVSNEADSSLIEIVGRPLSRHGRPLFNDHSDGRFIARVAEFIDPELYQQNREVTVVGNIDGTLEKKIGDSQYAFPVVAVTSHQLWKARNTRFARRGFYGYPVSAYSASQDRRYGHSHGFHNDFYADYADPFFDWWAFSFGWSDRGYSRHRSHLNFNWWWRR